MGNVEVGGRVERALLDELESRGFWCHFLRGGPSGQPCDVVAVKDNVGWLMDAKHCQTDRFRFENVRDNQRMCFRVASATGTDNCGFAVWFERSGRFAWLPFSKMIEIEATGRRYADESDCGGLPS